MLQDLRFALRMLRKNPGYTAVVIAALAAGIGANTTVFTLVNAVLFRGLPFENAGRILAIGTHRPSQPRSENGASYLDLADWRAQATSFTGMGAFSGENVSLADAGNPPERYNGTRVTANTFSLLHIQPAAGRDFLPGEDEPGKPNVALIGYSVWKSRYGLDPNILGRTVRLNEETHTIIGVMPEGLKFPVNSDLWRPLRREATAKRDDRNLMAFAVVRDGVSLDSGIAELRTISQRLAAEYKATNEGIETQAMPYNDRFNGGKIRVMFLALLGAVGFVLLIACANVANLMLARGVARAKEMSIRTAMGASRARLIRQMLIESVLLGCLGGIGGWVIAIWGVRAFDRAVADVGKPYWIYFRMDYTVFAYFALICIGAGLAFGLFPALAASRQDPNAALKEAGRGTSAASRTRWLSGAFVVAELSLSLVLLAGAGLMVRNFFAMYRLADGIPADTLLTGRINLPSAKYATPEQRAQFYNSLLPRLAAIPGVESAAIATHTPLSGSMEWKFEREGDATGDFSKAPQASGVIVTPGYFRTIGMPLLHGRDFEERDGMPGREAVIVNQLFAAKYFPNQDVLGKRLRLYDNKKPGDWITITGIAPNFRQRQEGESEAVMWVPYRQKPVSYAVVLTRTRAAVASASSAVRQEVAALDPNMPVFQIRSMNDVLAESRWPYRVFGTLFVVFAAFALVMASVGIFAVMAYSVNQRRQELGVRLALGATPGAVQRLVLRRGMVQLGLGLAIGLAGAFALTRLISGLMAAGVTAQDPLTFAVVTAVLLTAGLAACYIPARRAARIDPVIALRAD